MKLKIQTIYGIEEIFGHKIKILGFEEFKFFTHRTSEKTYYVISEFNTGTAIAYGTSFKDALLRAILELYKQGKTNMKKAMAKQALKYGVINEEVTP